MKYPRSSIHGKKLELTNSANTSPDSGSIVLPSLDNIPSFEDTWEKVKGLTEPIVLPSLDGIPSLDDTWEKVTSFVNVTDILGNVGPIVLPSLDDIPPLDNTWEKVKGFFNITDILENIEAYKPQIISTTVGSIAGSLAATAGFVLVQLGSWATLNVVGFTGAGVAVSSLAASAQSLFYGGFVASGSVFSILQSLGAAPAALFYNPVGAAVLVIGGIVGGYYGFHHS
ncbi:hypothetical protein EC973_005917 [Apophysomyces ossiformis]|uniref:Uncharacterized protein n=1 Tax=Apophysomyces ossiformis TaxID=679940 RepID=A0A8H7BWQ4_9FUNG|nr:hypothetical protein EC973_005917 [Apophysomyces ossiformis]